MRGKLVLLVGVGIGYVLGSRAGRKRYDEIKSCVNRLWNDPRVSQQVHNVEQFAKDKAPDVVDFIGDTAKKVIQRKPTARSSKATGSSPATGSSTASGSSTTSGSTKKSTTAKKPTSSPASSAAKKK